MGEKTIPERLASIEVTTKFNCKQLTSLHSKMDLIVPSVKENSWWIEKINWAFVFITVVSVIGGIVTLAIRS